MSLSKTLSQVFIITPSLRQKEITHSSRKAFSGKQFFRQQKGVGDEEFCFVVP